MIMKKNYLKPETEQVNLLVETFILDASVIQGGGGTPGVDGEFANRNRGEWGNVWGK